MQDSKTSGEGAGSSGQIVAWVALVFVLTFLCALPLIIGGISLPKLSPSAPLFGISFAGMMLAGYTPMLAALLVAGLFPGPMEFVPCCVKHALGVWALVGMGSH